MSFAGLLGQPVARHIFETALQNKTVHHAYRFEGPAGVGKTTAALLLAQALVCPVDPLGCEQCSACGRAVKLSPEAPEVPQHPDVLFVGRGIYPKELIGASEATGISVEQVRRIIMGRVGYPPHEGQALVIIIFDADELTGTAANALLKTLEEPPPNTYFILLTSRPARLLDTIRSRTLAIRFAPLPSTVLEDLLEKEGLPRKLSAVAQGSLQRARLFADPEILQVQEEFAQAAEKAIQAPHPAAALEFAEQRSEGRQELLTSLRFLGTHFAEQGRQGSTSEAALAAHRYSEVERAALEVERNGSPALVLESLILRLRQLGGS